MYVCECYLISAGSDVTLCFATKTDNYVECSYSNCNYWLNITSEDGGCRFVIKLSCPVTFLITRKIIKIAVESATLHCTYYVLTNY